MWGFILGRPGRWKGCCVGRGQPLHPGQDFTCQARLRDSQSSSPPCPLSLQENRCPWPPPIKSSLSSVPKAKFQPEASTLSIKVCRTWTWEVWRQSQFFRENRDLWPPSLSLILRVFWGSYWFVGQFPEIQLNFIHSCTQQTILGPNSMLDKGRNHRREANLHTHPHCPLSGTVLMALGRPAQASYPDPLPWSLVLSARPSKGAGKTQALEWAGHGFGSQLCHFLPGHQLLLLLELQFVHL